MTVGVQETSVSTDCKGTADPAGLRVRGDRGTDSVRRFPYPYRAMLAICSDLDCTPNARVYAEMMRFLNTTEETSVGPGVGLEIGNTIYFDMPDGQFSYWNTDDTGRAMIRDLIHSGHIDCLHSFGDLATTRTHAKRALDELASYDCRIEVWVDHSKAPSNFGPDIMVGHGDDPNSEVYHADLTCDYGVQFVWRGRTTSVIGQNVPSSLQGLTNGRHPFASGRTMAKQAMKLRLARRGDPRYGMHGPNRVLRMDQLRDGRPVYEFLRFNPHWRGVGDGATADGIAEVLTPRVLNTLVDREGVGVLYTHLGKIHDEQKFFPPSTVRAFRLLSDYQKSGKILVTTTRRLLGYLRTCDELTTQTVTEGSQRRVDLSTVSDEATEGLTEGRSDGATERRSGGEANEPNRDRQGATHRNRSDFDGVTLYSDHADSNESTKRRSDGATGEPNRDRQGATNEFSISVNGTAVESCRANPPDQTGRRSASIPWPKLEYPR